jgi:hypothetical protein
MSDRLDTECEHGYEAAGGCPVYEDEDTNDWKPGDPCGYCGSTNTRWGEDSTEGAVCLGCGSADSDG